MKNKIIIAVIMTAVLAGSVSALEIISPVEDVYNITEILLNLTSNQTLDSINYTVDSSQFSACNNCSGYVTSLNLSEGNHTILASGVLGNETFNDSVSFSIILPQVIPPIIEEFTLTLTTPQNQTYNSTLVPFIVSANRTVDSISRKTDSGSFASLCSNCSAFNDTLNLSQGNHTLSVKGFLGNLTHEISTAFAIVVPPMNATNQTNGTGNVTQNATVLNLTVLSPINKTYNNKNILLSFTANTNATMNYTLDSVNYDACVQCTSFSRTVNLSNGSHSLMVRAIAGNQTDLESVSFVVNITPKPKKNGTGDNFDKGFNKLPQMVQNGEISDADLAEIIRSNRINPGVINRLIKTGKLGNASLEAILDTQFNPPGILDKLLATLGFPQKSFAELILENYNVNGNVKLKLLGRDDLPKGMSLSIKKEIRTGNELKIKQKEGELKIVVKTPSGNKTVVEIKNESKSKKVSFKAGKQGRTKSEIEDDDDKEKNRGDNEPDGKSSRRNESESDDDKRSSQSENELDDDKGGRRNVSDDVNKGRDGKENESGDDNRGKSNGKGRSED